MRRIIINGKEYEEYSGSRVANDIYFADANGGSVYRLIEQLPITFKLKFGYNLKLSQVTLALVNQESDKSLILTDSYSIEEDSPIIIQALTKAKELWGK